MKVIFFVKSATVDISKYTIKDIPGSSGRLDVISRCIISALLGEDDFEEGIQIWIFLEKYGTFIFDPKLLDYDTFPKNELLLTDYFVDLIKKKNLKIKFDNNPLIQVKTLEINVVEALNQFLKLNYRAFVLRENGKNFFEHINKILSKKKKGVIFVVGNQSGDIFNLKKFLAMNLPNLSLGGQSYLASSVIRLIKLNILALQ